ncbi:Replication factor-A C terminal domain-containing protein [Forsythia ovata]|uniref:Replication factor-A C terminal domain-containing protein n=1 Tax=Forsythia ovata TaxID=205694 RepID=A0ABD1X4Z9_9LAMI
MTSQIKLIPDISPGQSSWTAKVVVAEKTMARTGQHSPVKYQNMVLVDPQNTKQLSNSKKLCRADEHVDRITDLIAKKSYMVPSTSITIRPPAKHQVIQIKDIPSFISGQEDQHFFWVKGRLNTELLQQSYWYMCCSICNKSSHVDFDELYQCFYCKCDGAKGKPRAKAYVQIIDCTGSMDATMIGETAESYLQCPATTLMDLTTSQNDMSISHAIRSSIDEACFVYIRATKKDTSGVQVKYDAVFLLHSTDELDTPTRCENTSNSSVVSHKDHLSWRKENKGIVMPLKRTLFSLKDIGSSEDEDCEINAIKNIPDCFTQNRGLDVALDSADEDSLPTVLNRSTNAEDDIYP